MEKSLINPLKEAQKEYQELIGKYGKLCTENSALKFYIEELKEENEKLKQIIRMNNHRIIYGVNPESLPKDFSDKTSIKDKLREEIFKLSFQVKELQKEIEKLKKGGKND